MFLLQKSKQKLNRGDNVYEIKKQILQFNNPKIAFQAKGVVIHETANPEDNAQMEYRYFNAANRQASAHFFIDSEEIVQTIETSVISWHAGRTANFLYWGIEMCNTSDPVKFQKIWDKAVWLTAHLFRNVAKPAIFVVTPENLMSHAEVSAKYGETDHRDPVSYFRKHGKTVDDFRKDVQEMIDSMSNQTPPVDQWKLDIIKNGYEKGILKDLDKWSRDADKPIPAWAVIQMMINLFESLDYTK